MEKTRYQFVADEIRRRIVTGKYPAKSLIPDQNTLAEEFHVSRMTVKKALDGLAREGFIYKQSGLGTYVLGIVPLQTISRDSPAGAIDGLTKQLGEDRVTSDIISFDVGFPNADIQKKLDLTVNRPVYDIIRLRRVENDPFILEHTYMPVELVPGLTENILKGSIYSYLHHSLNLKFGGAYRKIHASLATPFDMKYLEAGEHDPILEVEEIVWLNNGKNIEYSTARNRYDTRSYTVLDIR
ncbi:GntR family transcriptional regulator [Sporolactobacillus sp. KGMB 08714]|uniref:GntR family transcriptional regulator n=1 Tax=Sporolactobacillus sp. KGMB 08714 TaxID=3064704 RepID=UPI002FBF1B34